MEFCYEITIYTDKQSIYKNIDLFKNSQIVYYVNTGLIQDAFKLNIIIIIINNMLSHED